MMDDNELYQSLKFNQNNLGTTQSDWTIMMRSSKAHAMRVRQQTANAIKIEAEYLKSH